MYCVQRFFTFGDLFQDLFDWGTPNEELGFLVMSFDVLLNDTNQCWDTVKATPADLLLRQFAEPPLYHVEPGTGCWGEVEVEARVSTEPGLDSRVLVGAVIVHNQMKLKGGKCLGIDFLEKTNELLVPMVRHAVAYDPSIKHTERSE